VRGRTARWPRAPQPRPRPSGLVLPGLPRAFLDLGAVLTAPGCARAWTRQIVSEWGAVEVADPAELVASELVTNAVNACTGLDQAGIRLVLTLNRGELAVLVRDNHPGAPVAIQAGAEDEGGRGLLIVEHLSDRCGWYRLDERKPAKVTWAVITGPGRASGDLPQARHPAGLLGAGLATEAQAAPPLPARGRQAQPQGPGMRVPRLPDPEILARIKGALERL
jgi:anti-sigma regulatory factor (Ser/Thr protein kinase)